MNPGLGSKAVSRPAGRGLALWTFLPTLLHYSLSAARAQNRSIRIQRTPSNRPGQWVTLEPGLLHPGTAAAGVSRPSGVITALEWVLLTWWRGCLCNGPASVRTRSPGPVPAAAASRVPVSWSHRSGCLSRAGRLVLCPEPHGGRKGKCQGRQLPAAGRQAPRQTLLGGMSRPLCSIREPRPYVQPPLSVPDPRPCVQFPECSRVSHAVWLRPKHTGSQTPMLHTPQPCSPPRGPSQPLVTSSRCH